MDDEVKKGCPPKKCAGCRFASSYGICDYCIIMGHSRGSAYNKKENRCEKFEPKLREIRKTVALKGSRKGPKERHEERKTAAKTQRRRLDTVPISGERLKATIKDRGLTQEAFAKSVGSSPSSLWQIMSRGRCRKQTIEKFAEALGCCTADLSG